jgi:hypothetical protein
MQTTESQFFGQQNEVKLYTALAQDFQQKTGPLNDKQRNRLGKALEHYMREVWDTNGPMPLQNLNREVLGATANDFNGYLRREKAVPSTARAAEVLVADPRNQPQMEMAAARLSIQQGVQPRPTFEQGLLQDTGVRFEQLQQTRNNVGASPPPPPDFQIALSSPGDEPSSLSLYESAKKSREAEAARVTAQVADTKTDANPLARFMSPPSVQNDANFNPTLALPTVQASRGPLQQDFIIKQDDVITYKETEYNLFLYSADRDWLNNTKQNRYNFSVTFDPANNQQGFNFNSSVNKKFKNISRIELIKAIVPTEGLDTLVTSANSGSKLNALSYPYVLLRIPELDTNNFGTDNNFDNAFGVLQYDANWYTDAVNLTDGYLAMIPKFMKCQKVYHPTPLATLTKLTIQLQRPDGGYLSEVSDTLSISGVYIGGSLPYATTSAATAYRSNPGYLYIQTSTYFSQWAFAVGNRIQVQGLNASQMGGSKAAIDLVNYLQSNNSTSTQGNLLIVALANTNVAAPSSAAITDGVNAVGYANVIIVRCPYGDPTTGSTSVNFFGGAANNTTLGTALGTSALTSGALINLTHQTSIVLRVITREMDSTARLRPDNL